MKKTTYFPLYGLLLFSIITAEEPAIKKTAIFEEIRSGDKQAIRTRIENDEDLSEKEEETENNALHIAAENDDPEMIELLTTQPERSFFARWTYYWVYSEAKLPGKEEENKKGDTPAHCAALHGKIDATQKLLEKGIDPNKKNKKGITPLHYAVIHKSLPITQYLIEKGADINAQGTTGDTPIHWAIDVDSPEIAEYLITKGADTTIRNNTKFSPIFWILARNKPQFIPLLVKYQLHTQQTGNGDSLLHIAILDNKENFISELATLKDLAQRENGQGNTPMMFAAELNNLPALKILHQKGLSLNTPSSNGLQPIHNAAQAGSYEAGKYLLENGIAVDSTTASNNTPLQLAIMQGHLNMVDLCLYFKADINKQNLEGENAFLTAVKYSNPDIINRLKKHPDLNLNTRDKNGRTALINAAINDNQSLVQTLIDPRVDISIIDHQKENVLHKIARVGTISTLDLILRDSRSKKLLEQQNENGNTPLLIAIANDHQKTTLLLLEKQVNVHIKNNNDDSALSLAAENGNAELVQLLTERYKLPVNIITKNGHIPLFRAVEKSYQNTTKALLKAGASLLTKNNKNETIIHAAAKQPNQDILRTILEQKDRPSLEMVDNTGHTPLCWAAYANNMDHMKLLEQYGANPLYVTPAGNTIAHCATNGNGVDTLDYIIKRYPHLITTPNREGETPLLWAAKVDSMACAEKLLREDDFINRNIDKAIIIAQRNNHTAFARSLDQKIKDRKNKRLVGAEKGRNILALKHEIETLDQKINQKDWWHGADFSLNQKLSSIKHYSVEELYNKTDAECNQLFAEYTQLLDIAINRKHHLVNKFNNILQVEEAERVKKENERQQEENRKHLQEQIREQRIFEENQRKEEQNRIRLQQEQDAVLIQAQANEFERIRKQKEKDDAIAAQNAALDRRNKEKADAQARDAEMVRKQKELAAAVAAQNKAQADAAKHAHALEQPQSFFPMDLKPSAPPMEDDANIPKCTACGEKASVKPLPCNKCRKKSPDTCNNCLKKQKGQCNACWNSIGKFTQKEEGECNICFEEKEVTAPPCNGCKIGTSRYCAACLKPLSKCPTCMAQGTLDKKLMDEILKQK